MWQWGVLALMVAAVPAGDEAQAAAEGARAALAERLQVDAGAIEVLETEPAEWPNAALGCPEKGKVYAQVLTSGYRVQLGHEGRTHWLHVAGKRVVVCDESPGRQPRTSPFAGIAGEARRDLAGRLGIEEAAVQVLRVRPVTRTTVLQECPGLPPPSEDEALPRLLRGEGETLLLILRGEGETHRYRSDGGQLTYCGTP
jgi:hypothetical protein